MISIRLLNEQCLVLWAVFISSCVVALGVALAVEVVVVVVAVVGGSFGAAGLVGASVGGRGAAVVGAGVSTEPVKHYVLTS